MGCSQMKISVGRLKGYMSCFAPRRIEKLGLERKARRIFILSVQIVLKVKCVVVWGKFDEKAMIRNSTSCPRHQRERNTNTKDDIKYKTAQVDSQEDSFLPANGHQAILNKKYL